MRDSSELYRRSKMDFIRMSRAHGSHEKGEDQQRLQNERNTDDEDSDINGDWCHVVLAKKTKTRQPKKQQLKPKKRHHHNECLIEICSLPTPTLTPSANQEREEGLQREQKAYKHGGRVKADDECDVESVKKVCSSTSSGVVTSGECSSRRSNLSSGSSAAAPRQISSINQRRKRRPGVRVNRKMSETEVLPPRTTARLTTATASRLSAAPWPFLPKEHTEDDDNGLVMRLDRRIKADSKSHSTGRKLIDPQMTTTSPCVSPLIIASRLSLLTRSIWTAVQSHLLLVALCVGLTLMAFQFIATTLIILGGSNPPGMWFLIGSLVVLGVVGYKIILSPTSELECPSQTPLRHH